MQNNAKVWKVASWDKMELMQGEFSTHVFPWHCHDTYCLSLIDKGVESGALVHETFTVNSGGIVLINPNELHSNRAYHTLGYSIRTFYINAEVLKYFASSSRLNRSEVSFRDRVVYDPALFNSLLLIHKSFAVSNPAANIQKDFHQAISSLISNYGSAIPDKDASLPHDLFSDISDFILSHLSEKISLDSLAKMVKLNKFQFLRKFKKRCGVTPFEYVLQKRIEAAKQKLQEGIPLVQAALDTGFYDQSHFTNYFKKYIGVTPLSYQKGCNILQD